MPARPRRLLRKTKGIGSIELEYLLTGGNMFTGDVASFKNDKEIKTAYLRYKSMLLMLRDKPECEGGPAYFHSGQRFWNYYQYDIEGGPALYRKFQTAAMKGNYQFEFDFLEKSGLLELD